MSYRYIDDIATADVAFEASGASREDLFISAADALLNVMVEDITTIAERECRIIHCEAKSGEMLLFHLLGELISLL